MEAKYEVIIYWSEEDGAYIAEVPELVGNMADGNSYVDAVQNAQIVIQQWIDTANDLKRTLPEPKGKLMFA